ncbi:GNAT family N-acetyltransferase [Bradyrhizobium sp. 83012]|uniref:GNAT family N-acetyltransferase n=1 Tax=Bradyrhizobium aeschynomenes TaxID=2734909 RepID=A0ABX2C8J9_9BRAD|nr:GNAT family N-acetyltransferase [Bradyrhizobium aeschynomenes]NPU64591.1 GNAT family N-acetyltransferase [Bradyrhizobium aeschynomenes]
MIRIRKVDGQRHRRVLADLHDETFGDTAPQIDTSYGDFWIAYDEATPVGFCQMVQSTLAPNVGYHKRAGVLASHRGQGLQLRFLKVREAYAKRRGWTRVISDTAFHNISSSNNLIRAGYRLFEPPLRWAFATGLYWTKDIT